MTSMIFWLVVGIVLLVAGFALAVIGFVKTKNDGHLEPLLWLIGAAIVLALAVYVIGNVADVYNWMYAIYWGMKFIFVPLYLAYVTLLLVLATIQAVRKTQNVSIFGTEGALVAAGAPGRQWDFALSLFVLTLLFVGLTATSVLATVNEVWGAVPALEQGELKRVVALSKEIDQIRSEMGMDNELQNVQRNPFAITFHSLDITPAEQALFTQKLNAVLNPRGFTCTKIEKLRYEAPHSKKHPTGYCLVSACVAQGVNPPSLYVFRMSEPIGTGGIGDYVQKSFEGKLVTLLEAMRTVRGMNPTAARHIIADALNDIPVGGGIDDLVVAPTR